MHLRAPTRLSWSAIIAEESRSQTVWSLMGNKIRTQVIFLYFYHDGVDVLCSQVNERKQGFTF